MYHTGSKASKRTVCEGACLMCNDKLFHNFGAVTVQAVSPLSLCCIFQTSKSVWSADLRE